MAQTNRCKEHGCPTKVVGQSYCTIHANAKKSEGRLPANLRGYDSKWRSYRAAFLSVEPLCWMCRAKGIATTATVVDHITPVSNGQHDPLFWRKDNHQALCRSCHSIKTRVIDKRGFGAVPGWIYDKDPHTPIPPHIHFFTQITFKVRGRYETAELPR